MKILYTDVLRHDFEIDKLYEHDINLAQSKKSKFLFYLITGIIFYLLLLLLMSPFIRSMIQAFNGDSSVIKYETEGWNSLFGITIIIYFVHNNYKVKLDHLRSIIYYYQRENTKV